MLTLLFSPLASDEKQEVWAGAGDRRGCCSACQAPCFCSSLEPLWIRACGLPLPQGGPDHSQALGAHGGVIPANAHNSVLVTCGLAAKSSETRHKPRPCPLLRGLSANCGWYSLSRAVVSLVSHETARGLCLWGREALLASRSRLKSREPLGKLPLNPLTCRQLCLRDFFLLGWWWCS